MSFVALRATGAGPAELFAQAWALWGETRRSFTSDPHAAIAELQAAQDLFDDLIARGDALTPKQRSQAELCRSSINALVVGCEPESPKRPAPAVAASGDAAGGGKKSPVQQPYAGLRAPPGPESLPAPSMLLGAMTLGQKPQPGVPTNPTAPAAESTSASTSAAPPQPAQPSSASSAKAGTTKAGTTKAGTAKAGTAKAGTEILAMLNAGGTGEGGAAQMEPAPTTHAATSPPVDARDSTAAAPLPVPPASTADPTPQPAAEPTPEPTAPGPASPEPAPPSAGGGGGASVDGRREIESRRREIELEIASATTSDASWQVMPSLSAAPSRQLRAAGAVIGACVACTVARQSSVPARRLSCVRRRSGEGDSPPSCKPAGCFTPRTNVPLGESRLLCYVTLALKLLFKLLFL